MAGQDRDSRAKHTSADAHPQRAERGRFAPGNAMGRGGKPRSSITSAIRSRTDPDRVAKILLDILEDPKAPTRERVQVASLILDRLEGKAIARSISITGDLDGAALLAMSPTERMSFLAEVKSRRMLGDHSSTGIDRDPDRDPNDDDQDLDHDACESDQP